MLMIVRGSLSWSLKGLNDTTQVKSLTQYLTCHILAVLMVSMTIIN